MRRSAIVSLVVVGALATAWWGTLALVAGLGDTMGKAMAIVAGRVLAPRAAEATMTDTDPPPSAAEGPADAESPGGGRPERAPGPERSPVAIDIPRERVARLTARQLRAIFATDAVDGSGHTLGARLHGVGGLGVGLSDGDVVTSIDGHPTANVSAATAAALGATRRVRRARTRPYGAAGERCA